MAEEASKGTLQRVADKATDKVVERVVEWLLDNLKDAAKSLALPALGLVGIGVAARHWLANEWACINKPWCTVSGLSLGVLIGAVILLTAGLLLLGRALVRTRRELHAVKEQPKSAVVLPPALFQKIAVEDERLKLRWFIRRSPPREWRDWRNIDVTVSPQAVEYVLDGPFHSKPGCNEHLKILPDLSPSGNHSPTFDEYCPNCKDRVFLSAGFVDSRVVAVPPVRTKALEELQRMERNGTKLEGRDSLEPPIVLENPGYWNLMLPPPPDSKH